ncbi:MAG: hypothetical protein ACLPWG_02460 [Steroidobacteraceae bacterium]
MSTSAIAASSTNIVSSVIGVERPLSRQPSGDSDSNSGSAPVQGGRLFTALFDALTQFVAEHQPAPAATTAATAATSPAATASAATSTPSPASTSPASTGSASTGSTGSPASSGTAASSLGSDLQAFLHDLFSALRQAGGAREHAGHGSGRAREDWRADATPAVPVSNTRQAASNGASTGSSAANSAPPAAASTPATSSVAPVAATSSSSTAAYGRFGIVAELGALIKDLSNSQVVSATSSAAGAPANLSSSALANLNSAFSKLITDLGGTTSTASSSQSDTASLQAFLSSLLQNLQSGASNSLSPLGNGVNVSA